MLSGKRKREGERVMLFRCKCCWRPLNWESGKPAKHLWLLLLLRPAKCYICGYKTLVPFFWRHRQEH